MKPKLLLALALAATLLPAALRAEDPNPWTLDVSLYGVAASMSGTAGLGPIDADVDVGFDKILDNLNFGAMGAVRVGYDRWAVSTDVIYMDVEGSEGSFNAKVQQWMVQPQLEYRICEHFGLYAGARYNSIDLELDGPLGVNPSNTESWWDPVVGARVSLPLGNKFTFNVSGDVGGFGVGSDLTWQAFPYFSWQFTRWGSLQVGYRLLYTDYENGSGLNRFKYDILTHGPQLGVTFHF